MQPIEVYGALVKQQHALNETIAPLEKTSTATVAHTVGSQLIYDGVLYDVIANIAIGDTLTVGTNISAADDITTQISSVNTALTNLNDTVVQNGAHNLLPAILSNLKSLNAGATWSDNVCSANGVDFTVNNDGSITASGTANANAAFSIGTIYDANTYICSGCPSGGTSSTYYMRFATRLNNTWITSYTQIGSDISVTIDGTTADNILVQIVVLSGIAISTTFYPMIRLATDTDATYTPYSMTNQELTKNAMLKPVGTDGTTPLNLRIRTVDVSVTTNSNGYATLDIYIPYLLQAIPNNGSSYASVRKSTGSNASILYIHDESMTALTDTTLTVRLIYLEAY